MKRTLGLDVGDVRVGVALSDPLGVLATPLTIIERRDDVDAVGKIADLISRHEVGRVIVGLPLSMDGSLSEQAEKIKTFAAALEIHVGVPLEFRDERLTTVEAKRLVQEVRKPGRSTRYDAVAAALILQSYLDEVAGASL